MCGPSQAARPLISQSGALGLSHGGGANPAALDLSCAEREGPLWTEWRTAGLSSCLGLSPTGPAELLWA